MFVKYCSGKLLNLGTSEIVILFISYLMLTFAIPRVDVYYSDFGNSYIYSVLLMLVSFLFFANLFKKIGRRNRIIEVISEGTLIVLCFHSIILSIISHISNFILPSYIVSSDIYIVIKSCIVIYVCYYITLLSKKYMPWLMGK